MSAIFCPSVMCLPMDNLSQSIRELEDSGIDRFHLDVMDGVFVPNYSLGIQDIECICRLSGKKKEAHLMIKNPSQYIRKFVDLGVDILYIHPESDYHPSSVIQLIMDAHAEPGIVLSPGTSVESAKDLLRISKYVLIMTVNPGQAGRPYLPYVGEKIQQLVKLKVEYGFELGLDGACSRELIKQYYPIGVDSFILGTAAMFHNHASYSETMRDLRALTGGEPDETPARKRIKYLAMDIDGTLTNGKIYMGDNGEAMKAFDIKDGYAIHELLSEYNILPLILTGRNSQIVQNRANELGVELVFQGVSNKLELLNRFVSEHGLSLEEIAYIGDDMNDLECIKACAISGCPADAIEEIKKCADFISAKHAGEGAVRDFVEYITRM